MSQTRSTTSSPAPAKRKAMTLEHLMQGGRQWAWQISSNNSATSTPAASRSPANPPTTTTVQSIPAFTALEVPAKPAKSTSASSDNVAVDGKFEVEPEKRTEDTPAERAEVGDLMKFSPKISSITPASSNVNEEKTVSPKRKHDLTAVEELAAKEQELSANAKPFKPKASKKSIAHKIADIHETAGLPDEYYDKLSKLMFQAHDPKRAHEIDEIALCHHLHFVTLEVTGNYIGPNTSPDVKCEQAMVILEHVRFMVNAYYGNALN